MTLTFELDLDSLNLDKSPRKMSWSLVEFCPYLKQFADALVRHFFLSKTERQSRLPHCTTLCFSRLRKSWCAAEKLARQPKTRPARPKTRPCRVGLFIALNWWRRELFTLSVYVLPILYSFTLNVHACLIL